MLPDWNALTPEGQRDALTNARLLTALAIDGLLTTDQRESCAALHLLPPDDPRAAACESVYAARESA